jgi:hypothetical protein
MVEPLLSGSASPLASDGGGAIQEPRGAQPRGLHVFNVNSSYIDEVLRRSDFSPEEKLASGFLLQILKDLKATLYYPGSRTDTQRARDAFLTAARATFTPNPNFEMFFAGVASAFHRDFGTELELHHFEGKALEILRWRADLVTYEGSPRNGMALARHVLDHSPIPDCQPKPNGKSARQSEAGDPICTQ